MMPNAQPQPRTALAMWSLILGVLGLCTAGCVGVGAIAGIVLGIMALNRISRSPVEYGGKPMAITGIVLNSVSLAISPVVVGIIAAIAIPSLLRARVGANEAGALGDIRTMISAQAAYSASNGGYYDTPECLAAPNTCIPGYTGPAFLTDPQMLETQRRGYRRTFHPGLPGIGGDRTSPSSMSSYAYTAVPITPNRTGIRGFCGDETGRVCFTMDGSEPPIVDGHCAESCTTVY